MARLPRICLSGIPQLKILFTVLLLAMAVTTPVRVANAYQIDTVALWYGASPYVEYVDSRYIAGQKCAAELAEHVAPAGSRFYCQDSHRPLPDGGVGRAIVFTWQPIGYDFPAVFFVYPIPGEECEPNQKFVSPGTCVDTGPTLASLREPKGDGPNCPAENFEKNASPMMSAQRSGASNPFSPMVENPCNAANGNKVQVEVDHQSSIAGTSIIRYYNSNQASNDVGFGHGWSSPLTRKRIEKAGQYLQLWEGTGRGEPFHKEGNTWKGDPDSEYTLEETASGYTLTHASGRVDQFDSNGRLQSETDPQGRTTGYSYDSSDRISGVTGYFGHSLSFTYDANDRIKTAVTPDGSDVAYSYDSAGNLVSVTYADGSSKTYHYENASFPHYLTGITDENGDRFTTYGYNTDGKAILTEHAGGQNRATLGYDSDTQTTVTDAAGVKEVLQFAETLGVKNLVSKVNQSDGKGVSQSFDASNNVTSRTDAEGRTTTYTYNTANQRTSMTEAVGTSEPRTTEYEYLSSDLDLPTVIRTPSIYTGAKKNTTISYDANHNPVNITQSGFTPAGAPVSRSISMQYNSLGQVIKIDGPRGDVVDVTSLSYYECATGGACGQLKSMTNALGHTTSFDQYDANGRILSITDANGLVTTYSYDARGRITTITQSGSGVPTRTTQFQYDATGQLVKTIDPVGAEMVYGYNAAHELVSLIDSLDNKITYAYDSRGNRVSDTIQDPDGVVARSISRVFDARNRAIQINDAGSIFSQTYDATGNLIAETDANNNPVTTHGHDALDRLISTVDRIGGTNQYGYDVADRISEVTSPNGTKTTYVYDDLGNRVSEQSPDRGLSSFQYDASGNVVSLTDARGVVVAYEYDAVNRISKIDYPGADEDVTLVYDSCANGIGRLCRVTDASGETSFAYDRFGNVLSETHVELGVTYTTAYTYDAANRVVSVTYPDNRVVSYARDVLGRVLSVNTDIGGTDTAIVSRRRYRADHQLLSQRFGNGLVEARAYDARGQLGNQYFGSQDMRIYQYDANGNMIARQTTTEIVNYGFDALDRLTNETAGTDLQTYIYDANGNRLSDLKKDGTVRSYVYDANTNRLNHRGNGTVVLDAAGNTLSDRNEKRRFTYNNAGRIKQFIKKGLLKASYTYNYRQLRTRKVKVRADGSLKTFIYHYDLNGRLIAETKENGKLIRAYLWADNQPVAQIKRKGNQGEVILTYIHSDHLDTPRLGTDSTQTIVWRWDSEAFGKGKPDNDPDADATKVNVRLRFPGQFHDGESGLYYNWNRYYDPRTGRYITSDPIGLAGGLNTYGYVGGNPLYWADPMGLYICGPGVNCKFTSTLDKSLICLEKCQNREFTITSGRRGKGGTNHSEGKAADIGENTNRGICRQEFEDCFKKCFPTGSYGQHEENSGSTPGFHYHLQTNEGRGSKFPPFFKPGTQTHTNHDR